MFAGFGPEPPWFEAVLSVLAVWRLARLLARERGPFDFVSRLHVAAAGTRLADGLACVHCLALWLAVLPAALLAPGWAEGLLLWLAVAGGASAVELAAKENT
ncbi:hypothetical protein J2W49_003324 [Hydrogenophaga palleronii]|uniref:DUF1360 domain-containing protein n=1 Tax=Hydrogenophaga palleronii TaxID=65655 RepID=A0ABU1WPY0_9BURK|nr:hypothetical protein [Hydrogenophaga palleronii]MDR7151348.1 hypothetical protein [Hydrogenophaga palleronii]